MSRNDSPDAPADDIHSSSQIDEPSSDDSIDSDELYQEGLSGATNADDEKVELDDDSNARHLEGYDES
jgi:hypothetical protein